MQFLRLPSNAAAAACLFGSGREPLRRDFRSRHADPQDCFSPAIRKWQGGLHPSRRDASRHDSPALRPAVARSSARYRKVRGDRLPSWVRPHRCTISDMAHGALVRCISPLAAIRSQRGTSDAVFRARAEFPRQTLDYSSAPGFPDCRVSPANAVSLRQRRIASTRPGCPGLPGGPGEAVIGRRQHGSHSTPIISASPAPRVYQPLPPKGPRRV